VYARPVSPSAIAARVLLAAGLVACAPTAPSSACLTRADCAASEECVAGRCLAAGTDGGTSPDGGASPDASAPTPDAADDAAQSGDAYAADTLVPDDAFVAPIDAGPPPPGDTCADPLPVVLDAFGHGHAEGELAGYHHDHPIYCGEADGLDRVYVVDLPAGVHDVELRTAGAAGTDTMVAMSESCAGEGSFYSCHDDRAPGVHDSRMILHRYDASRVFVLVRGYAIDDVGHFTLDVDVSPVADTSTCGAGIDITGGAFVVAWGAATDAAPHPSCLPDTMIVSDVYRMSRGTELSIAGIEVYFGDVQGAFAVVDTCSAPITETWCSLSTWFSDGYYGLSIYDMPFQTPDVGYLLVGAGAASRSYSFSFYP
jgi:hypothetical protein